MVAKKSVLKDGKYCVIIVHNADEPTGKYFNDLNDAKVFFKKEVGKLHGKGGENLVQLLEKTGKSESKAAWKTILEEQIVSMSWR